MAFPRLALFFAAVLLSAFAQEPTARIGLINGLKITETRHIPYAVGTHYGFRIDYDDTGRRIRLREQFDLPGPAHWHSDSPPHGMLSTRDGRTLIREDWLGTFAPAPQEIHSFYIDDLEIIRGDPQGSVHAQALARWQAIQRFRLLRRIRMQPGDSDPNLQIVSDFAEELRSAFDSLGGNEGDMFAHYRLYSAKHIQRAVDSFVFLRKSGRFDASKFLVRPAIEVVFKLQAIERDPDLLYRIAFSEHLQDQRMARPAATASKQLYDQAAADAHWQSFSAKYRANYPTHQFIEEELRI